MGTLSPLTLSPTSSPAQPVNEATEQLCEENLDEDVADLIRYSLSIAFCPVCV